MNFDESKNDIHSEENSIESNFMDCFLKEKYSQINDLQKHLVEELQFIEKSKDKEQRLSKMIEKLVNPCIS